MNWINKSVDVGWLGKIITNERYGRAPKKRWKDTCKGRGIVSKGVLRFIKSCRHDIWSNDNSTNCVCPKSFNGGMGAKAKVG